MNERSFSKNERKIENLKMNCRNLLNVSDTFIKVNFLIKKGSYSIENYKQMLKKVFHEIFVLSQ